MMKKLLILVTVIAWGTAVMAADLEVDDIKSIYGPIVLCPGDVYSGDSELFADMFADFDMWIIFTVGHGLLSVTVEDDEPLGDTMLSLLMSPITGLEDWAWAISPEPIEVSALSHTYGFYLMMTGYRDCSGGYPAGYAVDVEFIDLK